MICYIGMGWAIIPFAKQTLEVLTMPGFLLLLFGGIAYTLGAIMYGIGSRKPGMVRTSRVCFAKGIMAQPMPI